MNTPDLFVDRHSLEKHLEGEALFVALRTDKKNPDDVQVYLHPCSALPQAVRLAIDTAEFATVEDEQMVRAFIDKHFTLIGQNDVQQNQTESDEFL